MSDNKKFKLIIAVVVVLLLGLSAVLKNLPKESPKPADNSVASAEIATEQTTEAPTEETIATTEDATPETTVEATESATEETDSEATESTDAANTATEEPKDSATEAPTEAATEVATEVPTEAPTEVATEAPTEVPTEAPAPVVATYTFRNQKLLDQHYEKHGIEMGFPSAAAYEAAASAVITNPAALHKQEQEDGDYVYYVEATNEFVVLSQDGYIRTYFLPDRGKAYYDKQ